ncbi:MAG TPA: TetR/AcrR family transcriptional regulator [Chitinophagaceae bacterium]|jgi:AcrR family transcriptional regulator|nr:TetR/AcrR family transcriptional regulator [Chitinophagaceae bacterium]
MEKIKDGNFCNKKSFHSFAPDFEDMETKERILEKAHELFVRYGIRSVSMDDIATQLGMSKKTLYQYFADKEELVDAVLTNVIEGNQEECRMDRQQAENSIHEIFLAFDMVRELFTEMHPSIIFDLQKYHPAVYRKLEQHKHEFMYKMIKENLESGIADGLYRSDINVDILTRFRIESMMLPFNHEVFPTNRTQLVEITREILFHFLYGLVTAKGQKLIEKYKPLYLKPISL